MDNNENRKTSHGYYSSNFHRSQFHNPNPIKRTRYSMRGLYCNGVRLDKPILIPDFSFIIPAESNTVALETEWFRGGLTQPNRADFGLLKHDWNTKVVKALEHHLPGETFTGKIIFHFHKGYLQKVTQ